MHTLIHLAIKLAYYIRQRLTRQLPSNEEFRFAEISAIVTQLCIDNMRTNTRVTSYDAMKECKFRGKKATYQQVDAVFRKLALVSQSFRDVIPADYVPKNFVQPNKFRVTPRFVGMTPAQIQARNKRLRDKWELSKNAQKPIVGETKGRD